MSIKTNRNQYLQLLQQVRRDISLCTDKDKRAFLIAEEKRYKAILENKDCNQEYEDSNNTY